MNPETQNFNGGQNTTGGAQGFMDSDDPTMVQPKFNISESVETVSKNQFNNIGKQGAKQNTAAAAT